MVRWWRRPDRNRVYTPFLLPRGIYEHAIGSGKNKPGTNSYRADQGSWIKALKSSHNEDVLFCCIINCFERALDGAHLVVQGEEDLAVVPMCKNCHRGKKKEIENDTPCIYDDDDTVVDEEEIGVEEYCTVCADETIHKTDDDGRKYCTLCNEYPDEYDG